jgi:hypothetical protein
MKYQAIIVELRREKKKKGRNAFLGKKWKIQSCTKMLLLGQGKN